MSGSRRSLRNVSNVFFGGMDASDNEDDDNYRVVKKRGRTASTPSAAARSSKRSKQKQHPIETAPPPVTIPPLIAAPSPLTVPPPVAEHPPVTLPPPVAKKNPVKFDTLNQKLGFDSKDRPDGSMVWSVGQKMFLGILEIDEHRHERESEEMEQKRMTKQILLAMQECGYDGVYYYRVNVAERKEIDKNQVEKVRNMIRKFKRTPEEGVHLYYVDYPKQHHHVERSKRRKGKYEEDWEREVNDWMFPIFDDVEEVLTGCEPGE